MTMTLSFADTILVADLVDCGTTDEFISDLPVTIRMADYYNRIKYSYFDAPISQDGSKQLEYEVGDIAYWLEGNELLIYYDHDHKPMCSDIIVIGKVQSGVEKLAEYSGSVEITFTIEQH